MKIASQQLDRTIEFQENQINELIIENAQFFSGFLEKMLQQINGIGEDTIFLTEGEKILSWDKNVDIIINPFQLDINQKKILNRLYQNMADIVQENEYYVRLHELSTEIITLLSEIEYNAGISLTHIMDVEAIHIFKMLDVKIETEGKSVLERIIEYIKIVSELLHYRLIIFVNLKSYLSKEELEMLYQAAYYEKIYVLLLESSERNYFLGESRVLIDSDMCEII